MDNKPNTVQLILIALVLCALGLGLWRAWLAKQIPIFLVGLAMCDDRQPPSFILSLILAILGGVSCYVATIGH